MKNTYSNEVLIGNLRHKPRDKMQAMKHGARQKCPNCGEGAIFSAFLKIVDSCAHCDEELHHNRADDAPPYFTIFIIGHIIIPLMLLMEIYIFPPIWVHIAIWIPLAIILTFYFLPRVKGALVGLQWALYMHGFDPDERAKPDLHIDQDMVQKK